MPLTVDSGQFPVGWEVKKLAEVCKVEKSQGIYINLPYVGMENIESNTARFIGSTEPQSVKSSTFKFSPIHILYGRLRPYLNKVLAPDFVGHCSTEIFPIKPSECSILMDECWFLKCQPVLSGNH
jgi:type I restriction enzyme, S subunit